MNYQFSLTVSLRALKGKPFKVVADTLRSAVKNEHGYKATAGLTDARLASWSITIRFSTDANRRRFEDTLEQVLHPQVFLRMAIKNSKPSKDLSKPVRMIKPRQPLAA